MLCYYDGMNVNTVSRRIRDLSTQNGKHILIGIEGFGGSGKTTISQQLADKLGASYIIHIDDFIVKEKLDEPDWDTGVFDHARLEKQVLIPASSGRQITYQKLLYEPNRLGEPITVPPVQYIIIEGISCYVPSIRQYYDFTIWVDTPIRIAKSRGIARDGTHGSAADWEAWAQIDIKYQKKYHPELAADATISNN